MIPPPDVQAAKATIRAHAKTLRKARPARVQPEAKGQREPRKRDPGYLAFLRLHRCVVRGLCDGPVQAAHLRTPAPGERPTGLQRKPDDARALPLCQWHHAVQHSMNEMAFWRSHSIDPHDLAQTLYARYLAGQTP
jgi:hypothetical protein